MDQSVMFFSGSDGIRTYSADHTGMNLPVEGGPWQPFKLFNLFTLPSEAIEGVNRDSCWLFESSAEKGAGPKHDANE